MLVEQNFHSLASISHTISPFAPLPTVPHLLNQFQHPPLHGTDQVLLPCKFFFIHGAPPFSLLLPLLQRCLQPGPLFLTPGAKERLSSEEKSSALTELGWASACHGALGELVVPPAVEVHFSPTPTDTTHDTYTHQTTHIDPHYTHTPHYTYTHHIRHTPPTKHTHPHYTYTYHTPHTIDIHTTLCIHPSTLYTHRTQYTYTYPTVDIHTHYTIHTHYIIHTPTHTLYIVHTHITLYTHIY